VSNCLISPSGFLQCTFTSIGLRATPMNDSVSKTGVEHRATARIYRVSPLVFAGATRHGIVFLDLMRNRYSGIGCSDALVLSKYVDDIPLLETWLGERDGSSDANSSESALLGSLLAAGILTLNPAEKREIVSTQIPLDGALTSIGDEITGHASIGIWQLIVFLCCLIWSAASLRLLPFRYVIRRVHRRRLAAHAMGYNFSLSRACDLVATFRGIRPFFFLPKDRCLLHALTLTNYLAHHNEFPVLVFGVTTGPWGAHAWVQHQHFLLDCNPEDVCHLEQVLGV
jgi:hypothetical protein